VGEAPREQRHWREGRTKMKWLALLMQLLLGFTIGTFVLWSCSFTVNTQKRTLKTSAVYNAIMTGLWVIPMGLALLFLQTESSMALTIFVVSTIALLIVSFILLMWLYEISFWATVWLVIAMWAVGMVVRKLAALIL
jgi:hypothetical protein